LSTLTTYKVQSPRQILAMDAKVKELIDQDTKWWNRDLIDKKISQEERMVINSSKKDALIWRRIAIGEFFV
jgi:hypothetical protein